MRVKEGDYVTFGGIDYVAVEKENEFDVCKGCAFENDLNKCFEVECWDEDGQDYIYKKRGEE